MNDKNVQVRVYSASFITEVLIQVIERGDRYKSLFEKTGGLDLLEKSIRKGLVDASPIVRDKSRDLYSLLEEIWKSKAERFINEENVIAEAIQLIHSIPKQLLQQTTRIKKDFQNKVFRLRKYCFSQFSHK
ncbi:hypothetical protein BKA69DRAFT_380821 [Paraphysoderma sedebokerense]|nr:hypothetical protein BKA69DRAFT_380821 [Paraphysoderma sedebokerense]